MAADVPVAKACLPLENAIFDPSVKALRQPRHQAVSQPGSSFQCADKVNEIYIVGIPTG